MGRNSWVKNKMLSRDEVKHIAKLANLPLKEAEVGKYQKWLSEALNYIEVLNELETEGVSPTAQTTGLENVFRSDDQVKPSLSQDQALKNAPNQKDGFIRTAAVLPSQ